MKIRPLHDKIIVKRIEEEKVTASGIVIPDAAIEKPNQGEVVAVANRKICDEKPLEVKVGDKILFGKYSGTSFKVDGVEFLQMREDDIIGVIED